MGTANAAPRQQQVNYTKLALAAGYKTSSSAYVCLGNVRKKAVGRGVVGGGAAVVAGGEGAEMVGGKKGVEQEDGEDEVVGVKKKCKIADGGEDDGEGEGEVVIVDEGREGDEG